LVLCKPGYDDVSLQEIMWDAVCGRIGSSHQPVSWVPKPPDQKLAFTPKLKAISASAGVAAEVVVYNWMYELPTTRTFGHIRTVVHVRIPRAY